MKQYQLFEGDCLEVMPTLEAASVDLILADPPYGTTACSWDTVIPFDLMWPQIKRLRKKRATVALFGSEPFSSLLRVSNLKEFKYDWVGEKYTATNHLSVKSRPMNKVDIISVFFTGLYFPQLEDKRPSEIRGARKTRKRENVPTYGDMSRESKRTISHKKKYPINIIKYRSFGSPEKSSHPTQKPIPLLEYLIKTYTKPGDLVLDFTMGSGSTGVACMKTGRRFIGIELDPGYFQIAQTRIKNAAGEFVRTAKEKEKGQLSLFD